MIAHSKPTLGRQEQSLVEGVLRKGYLAQGQSVEQFQRCWQDYFGGGWAVAVNCGTSALHLGLLALGVTKNDEVILPSYVCCAVLNAVYYVGARAVLCDSREPDGNPSPESIARKISGRTKAIIVPHMFGMPAEIERIVGFGIPVIEDCAQAVGAKVGERLVGTFGALSVFSFYATKVLTTGEGGMVLTRNQRLARQIEDLRDYDNRDTYRLRFNYKMTDMGAALGIAQLKRLPQFIRRRRHIAEIYTRQLQGLDIGLPWDDAGSFPVFFRYGIRVPRALGRFLQELNRSGVEAKRPVYMPLHRYLGISDREFPVASRIFSTVASLPIYPSLTDREVFQVAQKVKKALQSLKEKP